MRYYYDFGLNYRDKGFTGRYGVTESRGHQLANEAERLFAVSSGDIALWLKLPADGAAFSEVEPVEASVIMLSSVRLNAR